MRAETIAAVAAADRTITKVDRALRRSSPPGDFSGVGFSTKTPENAWREDSWVGRMRGRVLVLFGR